MRNATIHPDRLTILSAWRHDRPDEVNGRRHRETLDALRGDGLEPLEAAGIWANGDPADVEQAIVLVDAPLDTVRFYAQRNRQSAFIHHGTVYFYVEPDDRVDGEAWEPVERVVEWTSYQASLSDIRAAAHGGAFYDGATIWPDRDDPGTYHVLIGRTGPA